MSDGKRAAAPRKLKDEPLIRLVAINGAAGVCVAMLVMGGIFWANIGNLRVLVSRAEDPVLPVLMLAFALVITLGSVVIGSAIMLLGKRDGNSGSSGGTFFNNWTENMKQARVYAPARAGGSRKR
ncbi:hypothetical protein [Roseibium sp.]|uniref:hypothetical protein n=1 Tax=Roseibium sp. TaxID=1936156 RepID=UPI003B5055E3